MTDVPNQNNYQTSQSFVIDIDKIYSDFIREIDASRSISNISTSADALAAGFKTIAGLNKNIKVEDTPQESRLHCFYRLIGFPVVSKDMLIYNPGLDIMDGPKEISLEKKINIANSPLPGFKEFSIARENYVNTIKKVWSPRPATITATALALSSSTNVRPFSESVKDIDPFKFDKSETYVADFKSVIGANDKVLLTEYMDSAGNTPDASKMLPTRSHFIKPFIVDPIIDFTCSPASRKVAVPFVFDKSKLLVGENTFVKRPLIEKVIRDRFATYNQKNVSTSQESLKQVILSVPTINDEKLIQQMTSDVYGLDDRIQFQKYLFIIAAMCRKLVDAQDEIKAVQALYYWLPIPSTSGPEGGCTISDIITSGKLPTGDNSSFVTESDDALINATYRQASSRYNTQTINEDKGQFAFEEIKTTFSNDTTEALGDKISEQVSSLTKTRNYDMAVANDALRTVEIIMGEFSGLGLCDIIAIMASLYVMPRKMLLGFLDDDAYKRFLVEMNFELAALSGDAELAHASITDAQTAFLKKIKDFYNLMDDIYKQVKENNNGT